MTDINSPSLMTLLKMYVMAISRIQIDIKTLRPNSRYLISNWLLNLFMIWYLPRIYLFYQHEIKLTMGKENYSYYFKRNENGKIKDVLLLLRIPLTICGRLGGLVIKKL